MVLFCWSVGFAAASEKERTRQGGCCRERKRERREERNGLGGGYSFPAKELPVLS